MRREKREKDNKFLNEKRKEGKRRGVMINLMNNRTKDKGIERDRID